MRRESQFSCGYHTAPFLRLAFETPFFSSGAEAISEVTFDVELAGPVRDPLTEDVTVAFTVTGTAAAALTQAYLAVYGAATATDVAHFFGARVSNAKLWLAELDGELTAVRCGDRKGLLALTRDIPDLTVRPPAPTVATKWPLRLLPLWESMLMGHADKTWTVPAEADRKQVWRKAAYVAAVVVARGRVVATWTHKQQRGHLVVEVQPLSRWQASKHAAQVRREAKAVAAHLELDDADVIIAN